MACMPATMRTRFPLLLVTLLLVQSGRVHCAASYFFSPTGSDAAAGTSAETAWRSLNHSVSLSPGGCA